MRRRDKILLCSLGFVFILILIIKGLERNDLVQVVMGSIALGISLYGSLKEGVYKPGFQDVFGFKPTPEGYSEERERVNFVLVTLAREFARCDDRQREFQGKLLSISASPQSKEFPREFWRAIEERRKEGERVESELQHAKSQFWYAHSLAREASFLVKVKHTDYLHER